MSLQVASYPTPKLKVFEAGSSSGVFLMDWPCLLIAPTEMCSFKAVSLPPPPYCSTSPQCSLNLPKAAC